MSYDVLINVSSVVIFSMQSILIIQYILKYSLFVFIKEYVHVIKNNRGNSDHTAKLMPIWYRKTAYIFNNFFMKPITAQNSSYL